MKKMGADVSVILGLGINVLLYLNTRVIRVCMDMDRVVCFWAGY